MTNDDADFLNHIWNVLGYDTSDDAPPIYEQFYERHKDIIQKVKPKETHRNKMKNMTDEERREYFRQKNRERIERHKRKIK